MNPYNVVLPAACPGRAEQSCKKITILDQKDRDLFIDLDLLHDLDQFIDLLKLILIFDL